MEAIWTLWKTLMIPSLEEELLDFVEMYALRCSDSLKKVDYKKFGEIFDEDFITEPCKHDDTTGFDATKQEEDDLEMMEKVKKLKDRAARTAKDDGGADEEEKDNQEGDIPEEDFMIYIDDALTKIVEKLPSESKKSALNSMLLPILTKVKDEREDKDLLIINP